MPYFFTNLFYAASCIFEIIGWWSWLPSLPDVFNGKYFILFYFNFMFLILLLAFFGWKPEYKNTK